MSRAISAGDYLSGCDFQERMRHLEWWAGQQRNANETYKRLSVDEYYDRINKLNSQTDRLICSLVNQHGFGRHNDELTIGGNLDIGTLKIGGHHSIERGELFVCAYALYVAPEYRGQGYGKLALKALCLACDELRQTIVCVPRPFVLKFDEHGGAVEERAEVDETGRTEAELREWYQRYGFVEMNNGRGMMIRFVVVNPVQTAGMRGNSRVLSLSPVNASIGSGVALPHSDDVGAGGHCDTAVAALPFFYGVGT